MTFDTVLIVDWSGGNDRGPTPKPDAIWTCIARDGAIDPPIYHRNRLVAETYLRDVLEAELADGRRVFAGFDFAFGYPAGFAAHLIGDRDPLALWDWLAARVTDDAHANNRFDLAGDINAQFHGVGPFWGNGLKRDIPHLPRKGLARSGHGMSEKRHVETLAPGAFPVWQLSGAGAVGSQVIMGLPVLARLRRHLQGQVAVWPFEPLDAPIAFVEVWPSLFAKDIAATQPEGRIKDAHQVAYVAEHVARMPPEELRSHLDILPNDEGWIFGVAHPDRRNADAMPTQRRQPLSNDCFALPPGHHWTPVDTALAHLRDTLTPITGIEKISVSAAAGRFAAAAAAAQRAHPPHPNSAVDGYGVKGPIADGPQRFRLTSGRAAAGQPFAGDVPQGGAIRILTGANLPTGIDTVILQEDVTVHDDFVTVQGPLKQGANARNAGEDMQQDQVVISAGRRLTPADLATLTAAGIAEVQTYRKLRVGVLSTGDELVDAGNLSPPEGSIFDANRPMLLADVAAWGFEAVDLGRAPDDRDTLRGILDDAAERVDAILTSGGASSGDEDHMSALLSDSGTHTLWRIAMKPGRPLSLGLWHGTPVFGLPGNPVAAQVCALIFAYPSLRMLAGGQWADPQGFAMPAAFTKSKKQGRREYLRAKIEDGRVSVFPSEGSGRISGLTWATGLVALPDAAQTIKPGDMVEYIPFASFSL